MPSLQQWQVHAPLGAPGIPAHLSVDHRRLRLASLMHSASFFAAGLLVVSPATQQPADPVISRADQLTRILVDDTGDEQRALAPGYKLLANGEGVTFLPYLGSAETDAPVRLRLQSLRRGERALPLKAPKARLSQRSLHLDHGSVREQWDFFARQVEQTFVCDDFAGAGDLVLTLALATELTAADGPAGLGFARDGRTLVRYGNLTVIDGRGRRCETASERTAGGIRLTVPQSFLADATAPLLLDPLITPLAIDTGNDDTRNVEVAYEPTTQRWLVVYERHFSAFDVDVVARRYDVDGTLIEEVGVATGTRESRNPVVAANAFAQQFLVAWDEDFLLHRRVLGRLRTAGSSNQGPELVLADSIDSQQRPALGGSIATDSIANRYFLVCESGSIDTRYVTVLTNGTVLFTEERTASLRARSRVQRYRENDRRWLIVHERAGAVTVEEGQFFLGLGNSETVATGGTRQPAITGRGDRYFITWVVDDARTGVARLAGREVLRTGATLTMGSEFDLRRDEPGGSPLRAQSIPELTTDGLRFTLAYRERQASGIDLPFVTVFGLDDDGLHYHESHVAIGGGSAGTGGLGMASIGEATGASVRSMVVFDRQGNGSDRDVRGVLYDGRQGGPFVVVQPTACSGPSVPTLQTSGSTLLGDTLVVRTLGAGIPLLLAGLPLPPTPICPATADCRLAVQTPALAIVPGDTLPIAVPRDLSLVGAQLSVQGIALGVPGQCDAGLIGLPFAVSDTAMLTVR